MTRVDLDHVDRVDPRTPAVTVTEPARRDLALAVALGVGAVMAKVLLSLPRLAEDTPLVVITWVTVVSFVVVGVVLLVSDLPRANAWACLTVAWAAVPGDLNSPAYAESGLSALGFVLEFGYLAAAVALVLRYPHDRLSRTGRRLVGLLVLTTMAVRLPVLWLSGDLPDGLYRPPGWAGARSTFWHDVVLVRGAHGAAAILMLAAAVVLVVRAVRSRGLARQAIFPLAVIGAICSTAAAIDQAVWIDAGLVGRAVPAAMVRDLTGASIPIAVLAHILRRRAAAAMVSVRVLAAAQSGDAAAIERSLRRVLVDESLVLTPHPASGLPAARPTAGGDHGTGGGAVGDHCAGRDGVVIMGSDGHPLATVTFDSRVVQRDGILDAAAAAVRVGLDNDRLGAEVRRHLEELQASRARIVASALDERRRVERDLHDGAQQQFLAVAATLAQVTLVDEARGRELVAEAREGLRGALDELRRLARGIHPAALSQGGLAAALPALCASTPLPVDLEVDRGVRARRLPPVVESAAYFFVAEALSNAVKHSGAARVCVRVSTGSSGLEVRVEDDGTGAARLVPSGGLAGLADRVQALGGVVELHTDPCPLHGDRRGTSVRAFMPIEEDHS